MTFLDAARQILEKAGTPLHYEEITARAMREHLLSSNGATPEASMGSRLYSVTKEGSASPFVRIGAGVFDLARRQPHGIEDEVSSINSATRAELGALLTKVPPKRFEMLIMELLIAMGFDESTVSVTPYSGDGGVDVRGVFRASGLTNVRAAVQAKRWKSNVSAATVRELRGSIHVGELGTIITTSGFTASARDDANAPGKTPIGLIDGDELIALMLKHHVGVVDKSLVVSVLDAEYWREVLPSVMPAPPLPELPATAVPSIPGKPGKPVEFVLLDVCTPFTTWKAMALRVVEEMYQRHAEGFAAVAETMRGAKRQYLSRDPTTMWSAAQVGDTGWWMECNQDAGGQKMLADKMLAAFGYSADALQIRMAEPVQVATQ